MTAGYDSLLTFASIGRLTNHFMQTLMYFEDFPVGEIVEMGVHTISEDELLRFAYEFDFQPFHVDRDAAKQSIYGGLIASGWHTCSLIMKLMCENYLLKSAGMGSPGVDDIRWVQPLRPGDSLRGVRTTLAARPSSSKPDRGLVQMCWEGFNQKNELIVSIRGWGLFRRRPQSPN